VEKQVALLYCGTHGLLANIPLHKVKEFEENFINLLDYSYKEKILNEIKKGNFDEKVTSSIEEAAEILKKQMNY